MIDIFLIVLLVGSLIGAFAGMFLDWPVGIVAGCLILCIVTLFGGLAYALTQEEKEHDRLIAQCIADGKKEYECEAMLKEPRSSVVPMPIVIPMR